jgi:hypothetical protein
MKILAFLQNQWFKPSSIKTIERMYATHGATPEGRASVNARLLFYRSLTGRRLKAAFGDLCDSIVWEEASRRVGDKSTSKFPADPQHVVAVIEHFKPSIVLTFGSIALNGVLAALPLFAAKTSPCRFEVISAPHPACRNWQVTRDLNNAAVRVRAAA